MGGSVSNMAKKKGEDEEKFARKLNGDGTITVSDEFEKREILWWERILFDKRLRIIYVLVIGLLIGVLVPMGIFMAKLESNDRTIYGSCLIQENARFQCLLNSVAIEDEESCIKSLCCWENSDKLPFKCYHSFPSAYQYIVSEKRTTAENGTESTNLVMTPNQKSHMSNLQVRVQWVNDDQVFIEFFNPSLTQAASVFENETFSTRNNENSPFVISTADQDNFFYIRVSRRDTDETIFDTRLGPVISTNDFISLATILPTQYFYGLRGGQGALSSITYGVVHGFENAELPFYISHESSGRWHGVLLETTDPILVKVVQAPGIMFHLETDVPKIGLNFFSGPNQPDILRQLHNHIQQKYNITHPPAIPPFWGLGLHLCRKVDNAFEDIEKLLSTSIPYDTDCIDETLRSPIDVDKSKFENISQALELLESKSKRIFLTQRVTVPVDDETDMPLIMDPTNISNIVPFEGSVDNQTVKYIDFLNPSLNRFPLPSDISFSGINLFDNFPKLDNPLQRCSEPESKIQSVFINPISNSNSSVNSSLLWGSVCPEAGHVVNESFFRHLKYHNVYGHRSLKLVHDSTLHENRTDRDDLMITSSSVWTTSLYFGGYNGMQVPFTWRGLQDSVSYTVRNYALSPIIGTPICGSSIFNVSLPANDDLCLRWFQFGLLLPLSMNSYDGNSSYGPMHLSKQYQDYLSEAIRQRYTYSPYYFTILTQYQKNYIPFIRPMSFHFDNTKDRNRMLPILNQFLIGDSILAAPIIDRGLSRTAYFPAGVWYGKEGLVAWNNENEGSSKSITGHITETPMFFRGGHIIPILQNTTARSSIEDSLSDYSLIVALSGGRDSGQTQTASGFLTMKAANGKYHELKFNASYPFNEALLISITSNCYPSDQRDAQQDSSTTIDQIHVYGFPAFDSLKITVETGNENYYTVPSNYYGDHDALLVYNLEINWCESDSYQIKIVNSEDPVTEGTTTTNSPSSTTVVKL